MLTSDMKEEMQRAMRELQALLAESEALFQEFFAACKACQADIDANFLAKQGKRPPQEMVANAKKLSDQTNNISRLLKVRLYIYIYIYMYNGKERPVFFGTP